MRKVIKNEIHDEERAYYASKNVSFKNIQIKGPLDGESAFKESSNIDINNSKLILRYPCWHCKNVFFNRVYIAKTGRAGFWYCKNIKFENTVCKGVKAVRESKNVEIINSEFVSPEICWRTENILVSKSKIDSVYAFFESKNLKIDNLDFHGKYSFQYIKNMSVKDSNLDTKDAFWHTKNVKVCNSVLKGEYLGWYSENLVLENCDIYGTQPLCYCKGLKLINCRLHNCDLSLEYSEVNGNIECDNCSIKNPMIGKIVVKGNPEIIVDENDRSKGKFVLIKE